jgi:hypothetical protein
VTRAAVAVALAAAAAACSIGGSAATPAPVVRLPSTPGSLVAGQRWTARLIVRPAAPPVFRATLRARTVAAKGHATGSGRYAATLRLPVAGLWRLTAAVRGRSVALGRLRVRASYSLASPAQILAVDAGTLLVVERGRHRILRVDARTGAFSVLTRAIPSPWGLARAPDGRVLATGANGVYELRGTTATRIAGVSAGPVAVAADGTIYFAESTRVGALRALGRVNTLTTDVSAPHALVVARDGSLVVSDTGNGRLLRLDPSTLRTTVLASGVRGPLGAVETAGGELLVVEFDTGRLLRVRESATTVVVDGLRRPYALAEAAGGTVYVVEGGELDRPSGAIARIGAGRVVRRLRLVPPPA